MQGKGKREGEYLADQDVLPPEYSRIDEIISKQQ